ncbi:MAG TPA: DUF2711 family protein [Terracidiphilus sp.]|nr:DUF2711 family protein [Terracidiphilus sp.]
MHYESLIYPPYDAPLLKAYNGQFESVYVILHPFVSVPDELSWKVTKQYPTDELILSAGAKCTWAQVAAETRLSSCAKLNQALLTSIGSINEDLRDYAACDALKSFLESGSVWMPGEGRFEPLLQMDLLNLFEAAGRGELIYVPEFPNVDPVQRLSVPRLRSCKETFPNRGTLTALDSSFLLTVDWDSFFTLFYGPRAFLTEVVRRHNLEGFFATPTTEHSWFNYSYGCSAVTIYPDSWVAG